MKQQMKQYRLILPIMALMLLVQGQSATPVSYEGAAAISANFPTSGVYVATNAFPRNTMVELTNLGTGQTTRAVVTAGLDAPGLLAELSREAAEAVGLPSRSIGRIRIRAVSEPMAFSRIEDTRRSGDPDHDPRAAVAQYGGGAGTPPPPPPANPSNPGSNPGNVWSETNNPVPEIAQLRAEAESAKADARAARAEADAARADAALARREAEAAKADAEIARAEARAAKAEAALARGTPVTEPVAPPRSDPEPARPEVTPPAEPARAETNPPTDSTMADEIARARREAEIAKAEAALAKKEAEIARAEADAARKEAEIAKAEAEAAKKEVETAKAEGVTGNLANAEELEKARAAIEAAEKEAELAKAEAEAARKEAEIARAEAAAAKEEAEAAKADAEVARAEAEEAKKDAELARAETEAARAEAELAREEALRAAGLSADSELASAEEIARVMAEAEAAKAAAEAAKGEADLAKAEAEAARAEAAKAEAARAEAARADAERTTPPSSGYAYTLVPADERPPHGSGSGSGTVPQIFSVPAVARLEYGKYYLQIGASRDKAAVEFELTKLRYTYPLTVLCVANTTFPYRILVGPVNQGEAGVLLKKLQGSGYRNAFLRKGE